MAETGGCPTMKRCALLVCHLFIHWPVAFYPLHRYGRDRRVPHDEEVLRELPPAIRSQVRGPDLQRVQIC